MALNSPSPKPYIYWLSPTAALEQSLRAVWDAASRAAVLILPPVKLNSQLSSCTSFFSRHQQAGQNADEMGPKVWSDLWPQWGCVNYKLALTKSIIKDWTTKASAFCLWSLNPLLLQLLAFSNPWGSSGWSEELCAPGNLVGQVFR